ncbi:hypothetical protein E4T42_04287 [Aureobasidium subglaciale]|uniref:Uncharacterized protein n=1 Tax=Aureobasidium subglaciale (strain EXF-2481) TaxID=1043005 RepID=A0A074YDB8_AURSE|nr:uncharacterized protein AUEXF2481DRAFT_4753 [Aureobasidium subglaciale EXF-2481]KAI5201771.1 hypothetical protein E4T38_05915 [Aureobasidium subglaciale]KAI5220597.1 hypothetical protein E4T40_05846 [Aureobasidium subglaciale]KAI5224222.1 hypothetical protein E4T41_05776 [Aureobasidium subglaciale]KAI5251341.1 hypothetical protein E4T42_04287 [Aureobasidium subglaciale]KAI5260789.1 hypothetical protein E4T46_05749 [Aureobasidium subglaciale]
MSDTKKTVLITGCSAGGIGAALATTFAAQNHTVYATLRNPSLAPNFNSPNIHILTFDVTSPSSISSCIDDLKARGVRRLDVLVNNAGADFVMPLLDVDVEKAKQLYEVNVWGILRVTQACKSLLIEAGGVVCNICSVSGKMNLPWSGVYSSSKAAAAMMSETLRVEMKPLGVRVLTHMVGAVETAIHVKAGELRLPEDSYYTNIYSIISAQLKGELKPGSQPVNVTAQKIVTDCLGTGSGMIWRGGMASICYWATWLMPAWVLDQMMANGRGLDKIKSGGKKIRSS